MKYNLFAGWWQLTEGLGATPRVLVWDGEGAIGRWRGGRVELTEECQAFRGTLGVKVVVCRPADPEAKGMIERCHDHLERSFQPGRTFTGPAGQHPGPMAVSSLGSFTAGRLRLASSLSTRAGPRRR